MEAETIEALASGEPDPLTPLFCTDCEQHLVLSDLDDDKRCSCGSARVMQYTHYVALLRDRYEL